MGNGQFLDADTKIKRAIKHIKDIRSELTGYAQNNSYTLNERPAFNTGGFRPYFKFEHTTPKRIGPIIGDAVHNLRVALDYMVWEAVGLDSAGAQNKEAIFPFSQDPKEFKSTMGRIKTSKPELKDFLTSLEPYQGGHGEDFYGLHRLDIIDKHRILAPTFNSVTVNGYRAIKDGKVIRFDKFWTSVYPDGGIELPIVIKPGDSFESDEDANIAVDICFENVEIFPFKPVLPTLVVLAQRISNVREMFIELVRGWHKPPP
jgi:hypothetical protein